MPSVLCFCIRSRTVSKTYLALCLGVPSPGRFEVRADIGRHPSDPVARAAYPPADVSAVRSEAPSSDGGSDQQTAWTSCLVLASNPKLDLEPLAQPGEHLTSQHFLFVILILHSCRGQLHLPHSSCRPVVQPESPVDRRIAGCLSAAHGADAPDPGPLRLCRAPLDWRRAVRRSGPLLDLPAGTTCGPFGVVASCERAASRPRCSDAVRL